MPELAVVSFSRQEPGEVLSLFPSEQHPGVNLTIDEVEGLTGHYHRLYEFLISTISPRLSNLLEIPQNAAQIFMRATLVRLSHIFLDRLMRLDRLLRVRRPGELMIAEAPPLRTPNDVNALDLESAYSVRFNQSILCILAGLWELPVKPWPYDDPCYPIKSRPGFLNNNFGMIGLRDKMRMKLHHLATKSLEAVRPSWRGSIPTYGMAYETQPLESRGFLGRDGLVRLDFSSLTGETAPPEPQLRARLFKEAHSSFAEVLRCFLKNAGVESPTVTRRAPEIFADFLATMTPPNLLEDIPRRLGRTKALLAPYRNRPLVTAEIGGTTSFYAVAAARCLGMEVIGWQHGGGQGTVNARSLIELEFCICDRYITRGWRQFKVPDPGLKVKHIPMPSPWLFERAKMWRRRLSRRYDSRPHDILFMSDHLSLFPKPGSGSETVCSDSLRPHAEMMKAIIAQAAQRRIRVLHKSADHATELLLSLTMLELRDLGVSYYTYLDSLDKGMTPEMLNQCRLVLWDRPTSGFSECLAASIPTMAIWPRFSGRELPRVPPIFAELEACGVMHRDPARLCDEFLTYRASPRSWMEDPRRAKAVKRFCRRFAWSTADWPRRWRRLLDDFAAGREARR